METERMSEQNATQLDGHSSFDIIVYQEARALVKNLAPLEVCRDARLASNCPSALHKMTASAGIRALGSSNFLFRAEPEGTMAALLFYFVSLCEGVMMPALQLFITLAENEGNVGSKKELKEARANFGPAIKLLANSGQTSLLGKAPTIAKRLVDYHNDGLAMFRNSIAHFRFFLDVELKDFAEEANKSKLPWPFSIETLFKAFLHFKEMLNIPPKPNRPNNMIIDMKSSMVRYEEQSNRPITHNSRALSFEAATDYIFKVARFAYSCLFARLEHSASLEKTGIIKSMICPQCKVVKILVPLRESQGSCPGCDKILSM